MDGNYYQMVAGVVVVHVRVDTGQVVLQHVLNAMTVLNFMIGCILVLWHYSHWSYIGSL